MKHIKNKIVLVTGGASGIGRLMALDLAERGAKMVVWDINPSTLKDLADRAEQNSLFIKTFICDVTDREMVYRLAEKVENEIGAVDVLINNAGIVSGKTLLETPDEKIIKSINVNTLSLFWTCKAFLPSMLKRNTGNIVTIASAAGIIGVSGLADYSASKFGAFGLHEAVRMELRQKKSAIRTTIVCPFFIDTGMFSGVRTKFPFLLPILKSEYAAKTIVKAVLNNRQRLVMPRFAYSVFLLRLFPTTILDVMADFFGVNQAMDEFKGR
ncbi:MAG: SDR family oxidoreductase [Treponema sp.]|jgi:all-trans-retinol dehydrogenase (NAD+)|nr:SDR family oxidoreductase [Treponema sp.]